LTNPRPRPDASSTVSDTAAYDGMRVYRSW
jgi:hypothetical protein